MYSKIEEMYNEMKFHYDVIFKLTEVFAYLILQVCFLIFIVRLDNLLTILYLLIPAFLLVICDELYPTVILKKFYPGFKRKIGDSLIIQARQLRILQQAKLCERTKKFCIENIINDKYTLKEIVEYYRNKEPKKLKGQNIILTLIPLIATLCIFYVQFKEKSVPYITIIITSLIIYGMILLGIYMFKYEYNFKNRNARLADAFSEYYIEFLKNEGNDDIVIDILNRENMTLMNQYRIIEKYSFKIEQLQNYSDELHKSLLEHNRVRPTWSNILFAYYKNSDFNETIKEFLIKNANEIQGGYKLDVEEGEEDETCKEICESFFVDLINAYYTSEELIKLKAIASSLNISYELNERFASDEALSIFIAAGRITYNKEDLQYLLDKPRSLQTYVCIYDNRINDNFDEFFIGIDSHALKTLILCENIGVNIKQKLITEYGVKITVDGFEKEFYNIITNNSLKIPVVLLMRFIDCTNLTSNEKLNLATLASDKEDDEALPLLMSFIENVLPELGYNKPFKYSPASKIKGLLSIYATGSGRKMINHKDGSITINKR